MLLSKVVSAILIDFVTAQDLSNEYASQISRKYKQYRDGKENILNNFDAPASILKEIDLELKFAVTDLTNISYGLDVEKTWEQCRNLTKEAVDSAIKEIKSLLTTIISEISDLQGSEQTSGAILTESEPPKSQQSNNQEILRDTWIEVRQNLNDPDFIDSVNKRIYQKLFKTIKSLFLRGHENIKINTVKSIIEEKLLEGICEHPDFQEAIKSTQEIVMGSNSESSERITTEIRNRSRQMFNQIVNNTVDERDVRTLIQKLPEGVPHAEVMMTPGFLRELPIEAISSLKIKAEMERYQWTASETGDHLHKVKK